MGHQKRLPRRSHYHAVYGDFSFKLQISVHIPHKVKDIFAKVFKAIRLAPAAALRDKYASRYPKAIETLENGLVNPFNFMRFRNWTANDILAQYA